MSAPATSPIYADSTLLEWGGNPLDAKAYDGKVPGPVQNDLVTTPEQRQYQSFLEARLLTAQANRDRPWPEFSGRTYLQDYQENEKIAMTYLEPVKNEGDVVIASGTIEAKLNTLLSNIVSLNLSQEFLAFNRNDVPMKELGTAITDISDRLAENDGGSDGGDREKKMLRQKELLKQNAVFIQDAWECRYEPKKKLTGTYKGQFDWSEWTTRLEKVFEGPNRRILYGPNVYLGDVTKFGISGEQPYIFTVEQIDYDVAKGLFGSFENWEYVKPGMNGVSVGTLAQNTVGGRTIFDGKFRLTELKNQQVEIIKYQDETRDEFQIIINGVMQLPIGFPLSAVTPGGKYNIMKQVLYPINPQFAYGKSFVASGDVREVSRILDEMIRLMVLKTRKSFMTPYVSNSGRVISKRTLLPGNITYGLAPNALQPIGQEGQGVTAGEYAFYEKLNDRLDASTVSPIFQGQFGKSDTTATEVLNVQQQAQKAIGLVVAACTMMEIKLGYLRLPLILKKWFEPTGDAQIGDGSYTKTYRQVSKQAPIENAGVGTRRVIPVEGKVPDADLIREWERMDEKNYGVPSQRLYISTQELNRQRIIWRCVAVPKPEESSAYDQLQFQGMLNAVVAMVNLGAQPNVDGLETEFARVFGKDRNKLFLSPQDKAQNPGSVSPLLQNMLAKNGARSMAASAGAASPAPAMSSSGGP